MSAHNGMAHSAARILGVARATLLVSVVSMARMADAPRPSIPPGSPRAGLVPTDSHPKWGFLMGGGVSS